MYVAAKDFNSYRQGAKKKGDKVDYNATFEEFGLIEEKPEIEEVLETKPEPKRKRKGEK